MNRIILSLLSFFIFSSAFAIEGVYTVIIEKQQEKISNRWTLSDWLLTKQKIALMDQWLALNSSSTTFEFYLEGSSSTLVSSRSDSTLSSQRDIDKFGAGLYIKFFGLTFDKEKISSVSDSLSYQANIMLIGSSLQSTNITFFYGLRQLEHSEFSKFSQQYIGGSLTLYLAPFIGGTFDYRSFSDSKNDKSTYNMTGQKIEQSVFLDLFALRLKASHYIQKQSFKSSSSIIRTQDKGWLLGASLFF